MKRNRGGQYVHTHTMPNDLIRNIFDLDFQIDRIKKWSVFVKLEREIMVKDPNFKTLSDISEPILKIEAMIQNFDKVAARVKEIKIVQDKGKAPMMEGDSIV